MAKNLEKETPDEISDTNDDEGSDDDAVTAESLYNFDNNVAYQGAESRLYKCVFLGRNVLVKERFQKNYRLPELDQKLTKERIKAELKAVTKCMEVLDIVNLISIFTRFLDWNSSTSSVFCGQRKEFDIF